MPKQKLFAEERHQQILVMLEKEGRISVDQLSDALGISQVTIRSDLQALAEQKKLVRTHGGAILAPRSDEELPFSTRLSTHVTEKDRIAAAAASMVSDGDIIALDASTTALGIARHIIHRKDLTVVTNSLAVTNELMPITGINVFLIGGFLDRDLVAFMDRPISVNFGGLMIEKSFISARGVNLETGLGEVNPQEGIAKKFLIEQSKKVIAVLDSSKFGQTGLVSFAGFDEIDTIITDSNLPTPTLFELKQKSIEVIIV